ncbi:MAG: heavy-metal-associated domain-containing protein [Hyphomicrobiales bacterium]|nr:heavy-metal-associated domain-containing protein [Hyphomicrobiales bacterium]
MTKLTLDVSGMTCGGCARSVEKIIQKQDAASKVTVDLASGRVEAETSADPASVTAALTAAGFPAKAA